MWYLNQVWSINFVDDNEIAAVKKMILLDKISNSLEMQFEIEFNSTLKNFKVCWQLNIAMFSKLFWGIGLKNDVVI